MAQHLTRRNFLTQVGAASTVLSVAPLAQTAAGQEAAAEPVKVGIIGLDNYQGVEYAHMFNDPKAEGDFVGLRVIGAVPEFSPDIAGSAEDVEKWKQQIQRSNVPMLDSIDALLKQCDAVMIMSVDGRTHLRQAAAAIRAGKPVYIGRPMAASLADVLAIFKLAEEHKVPVFSCSQHRFSPGFIGMRNHPEVGEVRGCDVYGGSTREPHHPDLYWHAIHGIETLYTIMGPGCVQVTRTTTDEADFLVGLWKDGRVGTFRGIRQTPPKYSATVFGTKGVSNAGIYGYGVPIKGVVPPGPYMGYRGLGQEMAKFYKTRVSPIPPAETIELFAFMEAAEESHRQNGAPIKLETVLNTARAAAAAR